MAQMEIYAKLETIGEATFTPKSIVFAKNDAGIFIYFESSYSITTIEDLVAMSVVKNINEYLSDEYFKNNIDSNMIYLLTVIQAKEFLTQYTFMDKQCFKFLTAFIRKDKIKKILENDGI